MSNIFGFIGFLVLMMALVVLLAISPVVPEMILSLI